MCAACARRVCDRTAIVFKTGPTRPEFTQAQAIELPGKFCRPAAWKQVFHALRVGGADYIGGDVRPA